MNPQRLTDTAKTLVAGDKGLLAMDESNPTCNKRFAKLGIPQTVEARRAYRELIVTTPNLRECISGAILYDETIRQQKKDGTPFVKVITDVGIIPGIKVDLGAKDMAGFPDEKVTEGLDGLRERLAEYSQMGARFAKWRAVIAVGVGLIVCPRHSATGFGDLERCGGPGVGGTTGPVSSGHVQPGRAPRRIQCRDGNGMSRNKAALRAPGGADIGKGGNP